MTSTGAQAHACASKQHKLAGQGCLLASRETATAKAARTDSSGRMSTRAMTLPGARLVTRKQRAGMPQALARSLIKRFLKPPLCEAEGISTSSVRHTSAASSSSSSSSSSPPASFPRPSVSLRSSVISRSTALADERALSSCSSALASRTLLASSAIFLLASRCSSSLVTALGSFLLSSSLVRSSLSSLLLSFLSFSLSSFSRSSLCLITLSSRAPSSLACLTLSLCSLSRFRFRRQASRSDCTLLSSSSFSSSLGCRPCGPASTSRPPAMPKEPSARHTCLSIRPVPAYAFHLLPTMRTWNHFDAISLLYLSTLRQCVPGTISMLSLWPLLMGFSDLGPPPPLSVPGGRGGNSPLFRPQRRSRLLHVMCRALGQFICQAPGQFAARGGGVAHAASMMHEPKGLSQRHARARALTHTSYRPFPLAGSMCVCKCVH